MTTAHDDNPSTDHRCCDCGKDFPTGPLLSDLGVPGSRCWPCHLAHGQQRRREFTEAHAMAAFLRNAVEWLEDTLEGDDPAALDGTTESEAVTLLGMGRPLLARVEGRPVEDKGVRVSRPARPMDPQIAKLRTL